MPSLGLNDKAECPPYELKRLLNATCQPLHNNNNNDDNDVIMMVMMMTMAMMIIMISWQSLNNKGLQKMPHSFPQVWCEPTVECSLPDPMLCINYVNTNFGYRVL